MHGRWPTLICRCIGQFRDLVDSFALSLYFTWECLRLLLGCINYIVKIVFVVGTVTGIACTRLNSSTQTFTSTKSCFVTQYIHNRQPYTPTTQSLAHTSTCTSPSNASVDWRSSIRLKCRTAQPGGFKRVVILGRTNQG